MERVSEVWNYPILATQNTVGNAVMFAVAIFVTLVLVRLVDWAFKNQLKRFAASSETDLDDALIDAVDRPVQYTVLTIGVLFSLRFLHLPDDLGVFIEHVGTVVLTVFVTWGLSRCIDAFRTVVVEPWVEGTETKLDDQIVPILDNTLKVVLWSMAVLTAFSVLGYDVLSLLTGLGIGGVAVAMAAQATLSNVLGSVSIFADQPFQVDDLVSIDGHKGVVSEVGLRAVRIQTLKGSRVTVPNHAAVSGPVECCSPTGLWRYDGSVGLVYQTSGEDLGRAIDTIREILDAHPLVLDNHAVRFVNFGASSLEIAFAWYLETPEIVAYLDTIHQVNLAIKQRFDSEGFEFAYPTVTVHGIAGVGATPGR